MNEMGDVLQFEMKQAPWNQVHARRDEVTVGGTMAIHFADQDIERLVRELISYTGEDPTEAVIVAVAERLERQKRNLRTDLAEEMLRIGRECASAPVLDPRTPEQIIGYNDRGELE